jgi:hypothetical protein
VLADGRRQLVVGQLAKALALQLPRARCDPRRQDHRVDQGDPLRGRSLDEVRAQHRGAADVMAHQRRLVELPAGDQLGQHAPVGRHAHVLVEPALGVAEAEHVEHEHLPVARELRGDVAPDEPAARRAVHEHDRRSLAERAEGDFTL